METLIHADIFFFIASIGFVIFFILVFIVLIYIIKLLKKTNNMASIVEGNIETISEEAKDMMLEFRDSPIIGFLFGRKRRRVTRSKQNN